MSIKHFQVPIEPYLMDGCLPHLKGIAPSCSYLTDETLRMWLRAPNVDLSQLCSIDIETYAIPGLKGALGAGLLAVRSHIRAVQIYDGQKVLVLDFMDSHGHNLLLDKEILGNFCSLLRNGTWIAHNAQFEVDHFTKLLEMNATPSMLMVYCTMNAYRLVLQADKWDWQQYDASLKGVARRVLGLDLPKDIQHDRWGEVGKLDSDQLTYCVLDAIVPKLALEVLYENIAELGMLDWYKLDTKLSNPLAHMHLFGTPIDEDAHNALIEKWENECKIAEKECFLLLNKDKGFKTVEEFYQTLFDKVVLSKRQYLMREAESAGEPAFTNPIYLSALAEHLRNCSADKKAVTEQEGIDIYDLKEAEALRKAYQRGAINLEEWLVNPSSNKQLSDWMKANVPAELLADWPFTDSSQKLINELRESGMLVEDAKLQLSMSAETFDDFGNLEFIAPISKYKKYSKLMSTYGKDMQGYYIRAPWNDGKPTFHAQYKKAQTETGRLSTSKPSIHQCPRGKEFRSIFCSRGEGYSSISADYNQIELRVQAVITQDPVMLQVYETGGDIHTTTALGILSAAGKTREQVTDEEFKVVRDASKNVNFACAYLGGPKAVKKGARKAGVKLPLEFFEQAVNAYRNTYSTAYNYQINHANQCESSLKVYIPYGKVAALHPDWYFNASSNYPIQGGSFAVMGIALVELYQVYCDRTDLEFRITKSIHDDIQADVADWCLEEVKFHIKECMEFGMMKVFPGATLNGLVTMKVGKNWGEAE